MESVDEIRWCWVEFLTQHHMAPVFYWCAGARRYFFCAQADGDSISQSGTLRLDDCEDCARVTPHLLSTATCVVCSMPAAHPPSHAFEGSILEFDQQLSDITHGRYDAKRLNTLPRALLILALVSMARAHPAFATRDWMVPSGSSWVYRLAGACVLFHVVRASPEDTIDSKRLADRSHVWLDCLDSIDSKLWRQAIASAINVLYQRNTLVKKGTGLYRLQHRLTGMTSGTSYCRQSSA